MKLTVKIVSAIVIVSMLPAFGFAGPFDFFQRTNFKGAFGANNWATNWTALAQYGFLTPPVVSGASGQIIEVTDNDIPPNATVYWEAKNTYLLKGRVFVDEGSVLIIEPGTVIKGAPGEKENASALIVARGGKIYAEGTPDRPIIFTSENDDLTNPLVPSWDAKGLWGGVILLGRARINQPAGEATIEGIPTTDPRGLYGGNDDDDCSGVLKYVSIRHGGTEIGEGNEINGLTMGAVGRGTTISHVEVFSNLDDGFEWFGGTVNCDHLIAAFCGDDGIDIDEGLRNKMQFLFVIQADSTGDTCGEHDGAPGDFTAQEPKTYAQIYNATYLGAGKNSASGKTVLRLREAWGGMYKNSIFGDYPGKGVTIESKKQPDSKDRLLAGELVLANNIWFELAAGGDWANIGVEDYTANHLAANNNSYENPQLKGISRSQNLGLDPRPTADGPAYQNLASYPADDEFFERVNYKGAFGSTNWAAGWTALSQYGFLASATVPGSSGKVIEVTDADIAPNSRVYWTADNTYLLKGRVFVDDGAVLNIEAGTVIKGAPGEKENASALIVARGGKIYAEGTGLNPIILTSENDDLTNPLVPSWDAKGLWGGVILLGRARINQPAGEATIEGIPTTDPRGLYGGNDDDDCSGVLKYVSIRHGGTEIGEGNEINGLTMGAVGRGTTISHVEVFSNLDDGFEWFGGTVNCDHLIAAFCGDDGIDIDEGLRNKMQFLFVIQADSTGDTCGEHDGAPGDFTAQEPKTYAQIYNATYLGAGKNSASGKTVLRLREAWGGMYKNSIFGDYPGKGVTIESKKQPDSKDRLLAGELVLANNIWFELAAGGDWANIGVEDYTANHLAANNNSYENPQLKGISRSQNQGLDPRPEVTGPAYQNLAAIPTSVKVLSNEKVIPTDFSLMQNYPNPFNPTTTIQFNLPKEMVVKLSVYNIMGQQVATLVNGKQAAGVYQIQWDAAGLPSGMYFYRLEAGSTVLSKKMTLIR